MGILGELWIVIHVEYAFLFLSNIIFLAEVEGWVKLYLRDLRYSLTTVPEGLLLSALCWSTL